jgi:ankyrin repeat protein
MSYLVVECKNNNLKNVKELLKDPEMIKYINFQDEDGNTALMWACQNDNINIVKELLKYRETAEGINLENNKGNTALIWACIENSSGIVKEILKIPEASQGINTQNKTGNMTALMWACLRYNIDIVKELLKIPETSKGINLQDKYEITALIYACQNNNLDIVKELLKIPETAKGINLQDKTGNTALLCACENDNLDIIKELLKIPETAKGINLQVDFGNTALIWACQNDNLSIVEELLKIPETAKGINLQDEDGNTALIWACNLNNVDIVKELLKHPETLEGVNLQNKNGDTALSLTNNHEIKNLFIINPIEKKIKDLLKYTNGDSHVNDKYWDKKKAIETGTLIDILDLEDYKNQEYLNEDPGNIIFMLKTGNNYNAFGYPIQGVCSDPQRDLFFKCKQNARGNYRDKGIPYTLDKDPILKIGFPETNGQINVYLMLEDFIGALETGERVFLVEPTSFVITNTISLYIVNGFQKNIEYSTVSSDHCQDGTDKALSTIYVCYKKC